jgi:hypothetical protein
MTWHKKIILTVDTNTDALRRIPKKFPFCPTKFASDIHDRRTNLQNAGKKKIG